EHADHAVVQVRQVEVRQVPAAVLAAPRLRDGAHVRHRRRLDLLPAAALGGDAEILGALASGRGVGGVDHDLLPPARLYLVDVGHADAHARAAALPRLPHLLTPA